jgi:hypothetical protein
VIQPKRFLIGCWGQPAFRYDEKNNWAKVDQFKKWKERGLNTVLTNKPDPNPNCTRKEYCQRAADNGMVAMLSPDPDPNYDHSKDLSMPGFYAWSQPDEPELWNHLPKKPDGSYDTDLAVKWYVDAYRKLKKHSANTPVFGNFTGNIMWAGPASKPVNSEHYRKWLTGLDIACMDFYITNEGYKVENFHNRMGKPLEIIRVLSQNKPYCAFIECSDYDTTKKGLAPTPTEFNFQIWASVVWGVKGIFYFSHRVVGGFTPDATPPELVEAMKVTNAKLASFSDVLIQDATPVTNYGSFYASTRTHDGATYKFVVNSSLSAAIKDGVNYPPLCAKVFKNDVQVYSTHGDVAPPTPPTVLTNAQLTHAVMDLQARMSKIEVSKLR